MRACKITLMKQLRKPSGLSSLISIIYYNWACLLWLKEFDNDWFLYLKSGNKLKLTTYARGYA
jgi:hypothetical protein